MDYSELDCESLYALTTSLEPQAQIYRSPLINDKTHRLAAIIGTVFEPAHYYFAVYIPWDMKKRYQAHKKQVVLDRVRYAMSAKRCFIK